ncbi:MAG: hypothetical protein H0V09_00340 [Gemmatimonadetes bacterium]|nr:hypothetical protein [Gemmatimonadota bacterium]
MPIPLPEISAIVEELLAGEGAELVELTAGGSQRTPLLRVYVDRPGGTSADFCAAVSRGLEARLDRSGLLGERYTLEVSSPGLHRPLRTRRDFERLVGHEVEVRHQARPAASLDVIGVLEEVVRSDADQASCADPGGYEVVIRPRDGQPVRIASREIERARPHLAVVARPRIRNARSER